MIDFLKKIFLFQEMDISEISYLLNKYTFYEEKYSKGDIICSEKTNTNRIGFIKSGECDVKRTHSDGSMTLLNTIKSPSSFGILSAFNKSEKFPTTVVCRKNSVIVYINNVDFIELMKSHPLISFNVAVFLADRVTFLNRKVKDFSGNTVIEKLSSYLVAESKSKNTLTLDLNIKKTSETLNTGRASLYRAIQTLVSENLIVFENKKICINDLEGLERMSQ